MLSKRSFAVVVTALLVVAGVIGVVSAAATGTVSGGYAVVPVADGAGVQWGALVDGDTVVWSEGTSPRRIYERDLTTGDVSGVCTTAYFRKLSGFDGTTVVWADTRNGAAYDIYAYDLIAEAESEICTATGYQDGPVVDGDIVVWEDTRNGDSDLYMMDMSSGVESELVTISADCVAPDISGDIVVWMDDRAGSGDYNIYAKDIESGVESEVCTDTAYQDNPAIDGDIVVWDDQRGADKDIYMRDLGTGETKAICTATGNQRSPRISGDLVVWMDDRNPTTDVYGYDLSAGKEFYVSMAAYDQEYPDVDGTTVAFQGDGAADMDVFVAVPDTVKPRSWSNNKTTYTGSAAIKIDAEDTFQILGGTYPGSGVSNIHYKVDDANWSVHYDDTYTLNYSQLGKHQLVYKAQDNAGILETPYHYENFTIVSDGTYEYEPVAGDNRYETSIEVSKQTYPDGAHSVVVATAVNWPDALGGAALAGTVDGPILLVKKDSVPPAIAAEIERLGAEEVIILGGTAVVSDATEAELLALEDVDTTMRIGGDNRFQTAQLIAEETVDRLGGGWERTAFVATGDNFPDALAAAPIAARRGWPIFLAKPNGAVPIAAMKDLGVTRVFILGGPAVVTEAQEKALTDSTDGFGEANVERLQGDNRYETAVVVAQYGVDNVSLYWDGVTIATGENFPDALTGGIIPATNGSVMVLTKTHSLPPSLAIKLKAEKEWIHDVYYLGGTSAIGQYVRDQVSGILQ